MRKCFPLMVLLISIILCLSGCSAPERNSQPASSAPAATTASNANMNSSNSNAYTSGAPAGGAPRSTSSGGSGPPFLNNNANRTPSRDIKPPQKAQNSPER
jgi:hypothetical protein